MNRISKEETLEESLKESLKINPLFQGSGNINDKIHNISKKSSKAADKKKGTQKLLKCPLRSVTLPSQKPKTATEKSQIVPTKPRIMNKNKKPNTVEFIKKLKQIETITENSNFLEQANEEIDIASKQLEEIKNMLINKFKQSDEQSQKYQAHNCSLFSKRNRHLEKLQSKYLNKTRLHYKSLKDFENSLHFENNSSLESSNKFSGFINMHNADENGENDSMKKITFSNLYDQASDNRCHSLTGVNSGENRQNDANYINGRILNRESGNKNRILKYRSLFRMNLEKLSEEDENDLSEETSSNQLLNLDRTREKMCVLKSAVRGVSSDDSTSLKRDHEFNKAVKKVTFSNSDKILSLESTRSAKNSQNVGENADNMSSSEKRFSLYRNKQKTGISNEQYRDLDLSDNEESKSELPEEETDILYFNLPNNFDYEKCSPVEGITALKAAQSDTDYEDCRLFLNEKMSLLFNKSNLGKMQKRRFCNLTLPDIIEVGENDPSGKSLEFSSGDSTVQYVGDGNLNEEISPISKNKDKECYETLFDDPKLEESVLKSKYLAKEFCIDSNYKLSEINKDKVAGKKNMHLTETVLNKFQHPQTCQQENLKTRDLNLHSALNIALKNTIFTEIQK